MEVTCKCMGKIHIDCTSRSPESLDSRVAGSSALLEGLVGTGALRLEFFLFICLMRGLMSWLLRAGATFAAL